MKINLMPQSERFHNRCFICGSFPVKYRANVERRGTMYHQVAICNRCALEHTDMLVEEDSNEVL